LLLLKEIFGGFCNNIKKIKVYTTTPDGKLEVKWIDATESDRGWKGLVEIIQWGTVGLTKLEYRVCVC
jgi:hypothetical protein